jgi:hypothetical protein
MKNYVLLAFLSFALLGANSASAHDGDGSKSESKEFHCYKAWKKDWKSDKKEYKAKKKMAQDRPFAAARKHRKSQKKAWKSERKEHNHTSYYHWY